MPLFWPGSIHQARPRTSRTAQVHISDGRETHASALETDETRWQLVDIDVKSLNWEQSCGQL